MASSKDDQPTPTAEMGKPMIFFRAAGFYAINSVIGRDLRQQAEDHALLNPGTFRVEDMHGNVLWVLQ